MAKVKTANSKKVTPNETADSEKMTSKEILEMKNQKNRKRIRFYLGFNARFFINALFIIALFGVLTFSAFKSFTITKSETIKYQDKSAIDYRVYLKPNDFYDTDYLDKGMAYVASLIDSINVRFDYDFQINKKSDIDLKYKVIAKLVISSQSNSKIFYENEYELSGEELVKLEENGYKFNKDVQIDYDYYNTVANQFRSRYGVNTKSYLDVYLQVSEESKENGVDLIKNETKTSLLIPLSEQEINIGLEENTINESKQIVKPSKFAWGSRNYLILDAVLFVLLIIAFVSLLKKVLIISRKTSKYDKYVNRLLRGYDRLIVNVKTAPNLEDYNVIKVESFEELLDLRDNVKEPIRYYVLSEHHKCEFFITNHNDLYLYVVKSVDLEQE